MTIDDVLSTIAAHPTSRPVYSSFGFYGRRRGRELPGLWLVEALGHLDVAPATVRKTLRRMEDAGELEARTAGRHKIYRPSAWAWASIDAGAEKLTTPAEKAWSGEWTLVHSRFGEDHRRERDQVRTILRSEGFGSLGAGVYVHPRVRARRLLAVLRERRLGRFVTVLRGRLEGEDPTCLAAGLWDLDRLARGYRGLVEQYEPLLDGGFDARWSGPEGFALKIALVLDYLEVAWDDPDLPPDLLPPDWPGDRARRLVKALNERLLPLAVDFGDAVMDDLLRRSPDLDPALLHASPRACDATP